MWVRIFFPLQYYSRHGGLQQAPGGPVKLVAVSRTRGLLTNEHTMIIAGGGPAGLMLAAELALAGSRRSGLRFRTIEVLDQRGMFGRLRLGECGSR